MNKEDIVLITGGNSGMGKATAIELAKQGAVVVIACRNKERGEKALLEIKAESNSENIHLMLLNLADLNDIRRFVTEFKNKYGKLNILINNAGVILPGRHETVDGFELQFGVNHIGHFLLTNLLLDLIIKSAPSRIVNLASGAHKAGKIYFEDVNLKNNYNLIRAYAQSKLANILFTYELSERLKGEEVTANCVHPGAVATQMGINRKTGFGTLITTILKPFFQTPAEGASTAIYLAASKDVEGVTGKYYYRKKPVSSSKVSYNRNLAEKLWKLSEEMTVVKSII
jgi:NAD(P)-dependent dehydrogenase (short-subunit alcohol dehydrogenase family)